MEGSPAQNRQPQTDATFVTDKHNREAFLDRARQIANGAFVLGSRMVSIMRGEENPGLVRTISDSPPEPEWSELLENLKAIGKNPILRDPFFPHRAVVDCLRALGEEVRKARQVLSDRQKYALNDICDSGPAIYTAGWNLHEAIKVVPRSDPDDLDWVEETLPSTDSEAATQTTGPVTLPRSEQSSDADELKRWITVTQASRISGINVGVISRAVDEGAIQSNGLKGKQRQIDSADFNRWQLDRAGKNAQAEKSEPRESDEHIQRLLDKHAKR